MIRQYIAAKREKESRNEHIRAFRIQKAWRRYKQRKRINAVIVIQSFERMRQVKSYFVNFLKERLYSYQASRNLAIIGQRLWRGHKGRSKFRRLIEMEFLSDPSDALSFDEWIRYQEISHPPRRFWSMYSEYVLSGFPQTWQERKIKRNGRYRDVVFWVNNLTKKASWTQPQKWKDFDNKEFEMRQQVLKLGYDLTQNKIAKKLQNLWRATKAKKNLSLMLRARNIVRDAVDMYYSSKTENIVALCNYTLHLHAIQVGFILYYI